MKNYYAGCQSGTAFPSRINIRIVISLSLYQPAPSKLLHLIDLIEHASDNSCQFCGREKALEKITDTNWIIKTCSECES